MNGSKLRTACTKHLLKIMAMKKLPRRKHYPHLHWQGKQVYIKESEPKYVPVLKMLPTQAMKHLHEKNSAQRTPQFNSELHIFSSLTAPHWHWGTHIGIKCFTKHTIEINLKVGKPLPRNSCSFCMNAYNSMPCPRVSDTDSNKWHNWMENSKVGKNNYYNDHGCASY